MGDFTGKRILITGASRGIGFESAKLFLAAGAHVIGTGRDKTRLEKSAAILSTLGDFHPLVADFDKPTAPESVALEVSSHWESLDLLINNAAVQTYKNDWEDEGLHLLENQLRCNLFAQHELIFRLQNLLLKGTEPRVINVSSGAGTEVSLKESFDMPTYRLTKYALGGLTMLWAGTLKGKVAVNALDPGWLKTDLGGPHAPGEPAVGGERMWEICSLPWAETGKFWYGSEEIAF
jgi:NAD(P)-dependent dehydrogenase (short-subunit alcohol dehydrogenase family)